MRFCVCVFFFSIVFQFVESYRTLQDKITFFIKAVIAKIEQRIKSNQIKSNQIKSKNKNHRPVFKNRKQNKSIEYLLSVDIVILIVRLLCQIK